MVSHSTQEQQEWLTDRDIYIVWGMDGTYYNQITIQTKIA